jgi:hypothetical protein
MAASTVAQRNLACDKQFELRPALALQVARTGVLPYFNGIFEGLYSLMSDVSLHQAASPLNL